MTALFTTIGDIIGTDFAEFLASVPHTSTFLSCLQTLWSNEIEDWTNAPFTSVLMEIFTFIGTFENLEQVVSMPKMMIPLLQLVLIGSTVPNFSEEWHSHPTIQGLMAFKKRTDELRAVMSDDKDLMPAMEGFEDLYKGLGRSKLRIQSTAGKTSGSFFSAIDTFTKLQHK